MTTMGRSGSFTPQLSRTSTGSPCFGGSRRWLAGGWRGLVGRSILSGPDATPTSKYLDPPRTRCVRYAIRGPLAVSEMPVVDKSLWIRRHPRP